MANIHLKKIFAFTVIVLIISMISINISGKIINREIQTYVSPINKDIDWWPMFQHDNNRSGYSKSSGPKTNNVLWSTKVNNSIGVTPIIVDNKIYIIGYDYIYCLDLDTGENIWQTYIYDGTKSTPTFTEDRLYIGSYSGIFYCLDANDGSIIWQNQTGDSHTSPLVFNDKVYISTFDAGKLYCLNAENGMEIWVTSLGDNIQSPALFNERLITSSGRFGDDGYIYCINASNGVIIWKFQTEESFSVTSPISPLIYNDKVYIGDWGGYYYCLDIYNGTLIWRFKSNGRISTSSCIGDGKVFFADYTFYLYCLNADTGEKIWEFKTPVGYEIFPSPIYADGMIYFTYGSGFVYCLNASSGEQIWKYITAYHMRASPALVDGKLYICSTEGRVFCFGGESNNLPPITPKEIIGPTYCLINVEYTYNTSTYDPDGDQLNYLWRWAGLGTDWMGPYESNETTAVNVTFHYNYGLIEVEVIARDSNFATSNWAKLEVRVPRDKTLESTIFFRFLERFPLLNLFIQKLICTIPKLLPSRK